jgi:hypothetical protein
MGQKVTIQYIGSYSTSTPVIVQGEVDTDDLVTIPEIEYPILRKCVSEIPVTTLLDTCVRYFSDVPDISKLFAVLKERVINGEIEFVRN